MCARGQLALHLGSDGAAFVETDADADLAVALAPAEARRGDLAQLLAFEVGQLEILEHDVDELIERDVGFVVVDAGLIAGLVAAALALPLRLADDLAGLRLAVALPDTRVCCRRRRSGIP